MPTTPEFVSNEEMRKAFITLGRTHEMLLVHDRLYRRENGHWRRLDDQPLNLRKLIADANGSPQS